MPDDRRPRADARREQRRRAAEAAAGAAPSAARYLLPRTDGTVVAVDAVAGVLALDPRTRLRGRGDGPLRELAGTLDALVQLGALTPSGRTLLDVLVEDPAERSQLEPTAGLEALLGGETTTGGGVHDRVVRLATALLERARAHREGRLDLHVEVAPAGVGRHPSADELETTARVVLQGQEPIGGPDPAVVVHRGDQVGGWVALSPAEVFLTAASGTLAGSAREVAGDVLARWLGAVQQAPDAWWWGLTARVTVDAPALLQQAAAQAGSDHPAVVGPALVDRLAGRYGA